MHEDVFFQSILPCEMKRVSYPHYFRRTLFRVHVDVLRSNAPELKKAGNLRNAFSITSGEAIAIFDADFCPRLVRTCKISKSRCKKL